MWKSLGCFRYPEKWREYTFVDLLKLPVQFSFQLILKVIENGDEHVIFHKVLPEPFRTGSFVFDLIATDRLNSGQYLAKLTIGRIEKEDVRFRIRSRLLDSPAAPLV